LPNHIKEEVNMKRNPKFWFDNEKKVMKKLGLEPTKRSGSGWVEKEDGQNEYILAQLKTTEKESYKLNKIDVQTLLCNASVAHKIPIFIIEFLNDFTLIAIQPNDIKEVAKYLEVGKCEINNTKDFCEVLKDRKIKNEEIKSGRKIVIKPIKKKDEKKPEKLKDIYVIRKERDAKKKKEKELKEKFKRK
jgi:hypothetical protein